MQAEDKFLRQMNDELSRGDVLLDVLLKNKVELVKDIKGNAILPCSNHETVELKILEDRVRKSKITSLDFKKAGFGLLGDLLGRLNGRLPWRVKGMQDSWLIFKDNLLKAQNQSVAMFRKSSNHGRKPAWVSKELLIELKHKKEVQRKWKQQWATQEDIQRHCLSMQR